MIIIIDHLFTIIIQFYESKYYHQTYPISLKSTFIFKKFNLSQISNSCIIYEFREANILKLHLDVVDSTFL